MTRRLLFAALVVLAIVTVFGSIVGCEKIKTPTAPTVIEETPPSPPPACIDREALNYTGPAPCVYGPPPDVYRVGWIGASNVRPGFKMGVNFRSRSYPGFMEAEIKIQGVSGEIGVEFMLIEADTEKVIRWTRAYLKDGVGTVSLPHDGSACDVKFKHIGASTVPWAEMTVFYKKE